MMPKIFCMISLIAFSAINSVNSQDIDPQYIPRPSTVKGPEIEDTTTTTVINEDMSTTTEGATTLTTLDVQTETEPIPTVEVFPITSTTNEAVASTTETARPATDSTTTRPSISEDTTKKVITTTTLPPSSRIPQRPPQGASPSVLCRTIIQHGPLSYNRFYGIFTIPKTCYYCCRIACTEDIGIERCTEISPFYCSLSK